MDASGLFRLVNLLLCSFIIVSLVLDATLEIDGTVVGSFGLLYLGLVEHVQDAA